MARKEKISKKLKNVSIIILCLLTILIISLIAVLIIKIIKPKTFYKIEDRQKQIQENRKDDNEDSFTKGWVRVQGTNIDYPLYSFNKDAENIPVDKSLVWDLNYDKEFHSVMHVYGHNIKNLGPNPRRHDETFDRLEELMSFVYYDFAQNNKYFQITIDDKDYLYKIFAINFINPNLLYGYSRTSFTKEPDKKIYINELKNNSIYDYDIDVNVKDDIASIVTCSRFFHKKSLNFVVSGRLVRENEKIENYNVYKNEIYKSKIIPNMKGENVEYEINE